MTFPTSLSVLGIILFSGCFASNVIAGTPCASNASNLCYHGSQCVEENSTSTGFKCLCIPGYTGQRCEVDIDECDSKPCQNGGRCEDGVKNFTCTCARGFTGATCERRSKDCTDPPGIANGRVRSPSKKFAMYICNRGYKTIGIRVITCRNSRWTGNPPTCQRGSKPLSCATPRRIKHGDFEPHENNYLVGTTVTYFCRNNYRLRGSAEMTCNNNRNWSPKQLPRCIRRAKCKDPGTPEHGRRDGSLFLLGTQVRFSCDDGYELVGLNSLQCVPLCGSCRTVRWNGTTPTCQKNDPLRGLKRVADRLREHFIDKLSWMTTDSLARAGLSSGAGGLDLVFVFDSSASVGSANFKKGVEFAKTIIEEFGISASPMGTRVAVITFSSTAKVIFNLKTNAMANKAEAIRTLENLDFIAGGTATRLALNKTIEEIVPEARKDSKRALFLITDGRSNIGGDPSADAVILRDFQKFEIYAIGVTDSVDEKELRSIASEPFRTHVYLLKNFDDLAKLKQLITTKGNDYSECGLAGDTQLRNDDDENLRFVGGREAKPGAWPWQAAIYVKGNFRCGGALIKGNWVLTVAHCFFYDGAVKPKDVVVRMGEHNRFKEEGAEQNIRAKKLILHPNATRGNLHVGDDLALIRLKHPVKFSPLVRTVCLPEPTDVFYVRPRKPCVVAGWGSSQKVSSDDLAGPPNEVLQQIQIKFVSQRDCRENATNAAAITENVVCAGDASGEKDACKGDSGSPLVEMTTNFNAQGLGCQIPFFLGVSPSGGSFNNSEIRRSLDDSWAVIGLSSWGDGCATKGKYGVYTRLKSHLRWIKRKINRKNGNGKKNID